MNDLVVPVNNRIKVCLFKSDEELCHLTIGAEKLSDEELSQVLKRELCKIDGVFCGDCVGKDIQSFDIERDCPHRYFVTPLDKNGNPITDLVMVDEKVDEKANSMTSMAASGTSGKAFQLSQMKAMLGGVDVENKD